VICWPLNTGSWQAQRSSSNDELLAVVNQVGQIRLLRWNSQNGSLIHSIVPSIGMSAVAIEDTPQCNNQLPTINEMLCYDRLTGWLIAIECVDLTSRFVVQLPALGAANQPFAMVLDSFRQKLVVSILGQTQLKVVNLERRNYETVENGPSFPSGVTGFTSAVIDFKADRIIFTGTSAGIDKFYHYSFPKRSSPALLPQGKWRDFDCNGVRSSTAGRFEWENLGGDWYGSGGVAQSTTPYVSFTVPGSIGTVTVATSAPLVTFINAQIAAGSPGMILRGSGNIAFASRTNTDTTRRPKLTVVANSITYVCLCTDYNKLSDGSATGTLWNQPTLAFDYPQIINFDLSAIVGTVTSATLQFYNAANDNARTVGIYLPRIPLLGEVGETPVPIAVLGFSEDYPNDVGISAHPAVVMASDFSAGWEANFPDVNGNGTNIFGLVSTQYETTLKSTSFESVFRYCSNSAANQRIFMSNYGEPEADELFFRATVLFKENFGSIIEGGKNGFGTDHRWPGVESGNGGSGLTGLREYISNATCTNYVVNLPAGTITTLNGPGNMPVGTRMRFCFWTPPPPFVEGQDYYVVSVPSSNTYALSDSLGGSPIVATGPQTGFRNLNGFATYIAWNSAITGNVIGYSGGSARTNQFNTVIGTPCENYVIFTGYIYSADLGYNQYGMGVLLNSGGRNWVVKKNQWYSVEVRVKMNTLYGPADHLGNQQANPDGIYQLWMHKVGDPGNPTLVAEHTSLTWRFHSAMKIKAAWNDWVHGGQLSTLSEHAFRMSDFVVATQYIGPKRVV
jgi:hypothetical protein